DRAGDYQLLAEVKSAVATGHIGVRVNNETLAVDAALPQSEHWQRVPLTKVKLLVGTNKIRIYATAGGYQFLSLRLKN
ncbi:MAG: hypothetical protein K0Q67_3057, partial [Cellvibrio sp.]|nr:hypothetical protein [Cellvibrio sp.]